MKRQVIFYRKQNGNCPVETFLDSLSSKVAQKVTWVLSLLEDLDVIPKQYFKKLVSKENIWECRIRKGSNHYRILGFMYKNNFVVLTHGFIKKSSKVPIREIKKAIDFKKDFLRQRGDI